MQSLFNIVSLNRHYVSASLVYLGMTFLLLCAVPEIILYAQDDGGQETSCSHTVTEVLENGETITKTVPGCSAGHTCCELTGECVEID
jgi:hypothetical protein